MLESIDLVKKAQSPFDDRVTTFCPQCLDTITGVVRETERGVVMEKMEKFLNSYLFRNAFISIIFGMFFTAFVQSSSITTSLIVPLAGAGLLSLEQIFPYTLGANIGTTITALLASLSVGNPAALTIALCHFIFNIGNSIFKL